MRLKQICNHPSQWLGDGSWTEEDSGKLTRLRDIAEVIAARQDKALVFTQFRETTAPTVRCRLSQDLNRQSRSGLGSGASNADNSTPHDGLVFVAVCCMSTVPSPGSGVGPSFNSKVSRLGGSTIVSSNLPFEEWTSVYGNQRLTGALHDHLTHHVHILELNGESYRLKQSKARRQQAAQPAKQIADHEGDETSDS